MLDLLHLNQCTITIWEFLMKYTTKPSIIATLFIILNCIPGCSSASDKKESTVKSHTTEKQVTTQMNVHIIVGSTRITKTGLKIAQNIKAMVDKRSEINAEIVDIASYNLPFYVDEVAPANRKGEVTDPAFKNWSDTIKKADGYIIVSPVYNDGYTAPLKNALDCLYKEWNNKPVAFIGYSGGPNGGAGMIAQLRQVVRELRMIPIAADIKIPFSWKAFNENGGLVNADTIEKELTLVIDQLLEAQSKKVAQTQ